MVEFGMILANLKQVGMASRIGSERASQTAGLPTAGPVPADIVLTVQQQLQTAGMTPSRIVLQHNTDSMSMTQYTLITDIGSGSTNTPSTTAPLPATEKYVRLTVFVPLTELTANMLATFGFDISTREVEHTTTFRYEQ